MITINRKHRQQPPLLIYTKYIDKNSDFDVFRWAGTVTRDKRLTLVGNNGSITGTDSLRYGLYKIGIRYLAMQVTVLEVLI